MKLLPKLFTPIGRRMVIQIIRVDVTEAGIHIPESSQTTLDIPEALVVAVGPECKQCERGDRVLILSTTNVGKFRYQGQDLAVVNEEHNILGIVDKTDYVVNFREEELLSLLQGVSTMPAQKGKSGILVAALGEEGRKVHEAHKADETTYGNAQLPPGIEGGLARLVDVRFGIYKEGDFKGKPFFMAAGTCITPDEHNGVPCAGNRTSIGPEPICNTPNSQGKKKTMKDHYAWVLNELRKLGLDTKNVTFDNIEAHATALQKASPYFRFRTWRGKPSEEFPDPRTNHEWIRYCDPPSGSDGQMTPGTSATSDGSPEAPPEDTDLDLDALAVQAMAEEASAERDHAIDTITAKALEVGVSQEEINDSDSYQAVVEMIRAKETEGGDGGAAGDSTDTPPADDPWEPKVTEVYSYRVIDPATGKPAMNKRTKKANPPIDVVVMSVNKEKKTVSVVDSATKKVKYTAKWEQLESGVE